MVSTRALGRKSHYEGVDCASYSLSGSAESGDGVTTAADGVGDQVMCSPGTARNCLSQLCGWSWDGDAAAAFLVECSRAGGVSRGLVTLEG